MKITLISLVGIFAFTTLYSQTGPAGIGNSTSNIIWLEANDLTGPLSDGFTWPDKSGNGNDAVDIVDGSNVVTLTTISGQNYLRFAGIVDEQLTIADDPDLDNSSEFSVIVVFNSGATDTRAIISKRLSSAGANRSWTMFYNSGFNMFGYAGATTVGGSGSVASAGNPYIATMTVDAALSGGSVKMFVNSDAEGSTGSNVSIPDRTEDILIGEFHDGDGRFFDGDIAEIIVYRDALNGGERIVLENYLANKYGITISADYFGNDGDYDLDYNADIRGIGTENGTELHSISGFSDGLQLEAVSSLDNADEFVLFAHDNSVSHADNETLNTTDPDIIDRWNKDFYVEASQGGVIDAASVNVKFSFDFGEAGLTRTGSSSDYVLLYRAANTDEFTRVFATNYIFENTDQVSVTIPASRLQTGYYTLGRGTQLTSRTWYVLQNGNWSDPSTWTLDAGTAPIPDNDLNEIPGNEDEVIIRNGKTVTIQSTTNNLALSSLTVDGILDLTTSSGNDFNIINGSGTISMQGNGGVSNFPDGGTTSSDGFGNPANGGLLLVEGTGLEFDQTAIFKDVRISLTNATDVVSLGTDLTINGDFNVRFGTFQFGDGSNVNRTLNVIGDFLVENNGGSQDGRVSTALAIGSNTRHQFNLFGDFLNEGTAQFSDRTAIDYGAESSDGVVDFNLVSTIQDQRVDCNGPTYFYRIEVVKGSTDFTAFIQADNPGNFFLTGFANVNTGGDITVDTDNANAFGLITGSVSVGTNVSVRLNTTGNYSIGSNARLIVNGGEVTKTGGAAITPYGVIEVAEGILEVPSGSGITTRDNGQIIISGGEIWASQIRTSIFGASAQGGFEQSGGTVNVWDYSAAESPVLGEAAGSASADYARFCLTYEGNAFTMTGGVLNVKDATTNGLMFINSDPANINVTGGQVNAYSSTTGASTIASNAGFWNLSTIQESTGTISIATLTCGPGGSDDRTITNPDLVVLSDLTIGNGSELVMNDNDLYIGEDLTVEENISGVTYQPGNNTTYFNGDLSGLVTLNSTQATAGTGRLIFNNLILDKSSSDLGIFCSYNLPNFGSTVIRVAGDITIESGFWNQGDENLDLQGDNVTVKGILGVYEPGVIEGEIVLRNSDFNLVTTDGAQFGYVRDNNRFTINLTSDVYIQRLRWRRGLWNLGTHNLRIDQLDIRPNTDEQGADYIDEDGITVCVNCLSANYMFSTEGNASDGGLSLLVRSDGINRGILRSDNGTPPNRDINDYRGNFVANTTGGGVGDNLFIFPMGVGSSGIDIEFGDPSGTTTADTAKYTPLYLDIQDVTGVTEDSVYVTVRPVDGELQTTELTGGDLLSYYWNVEHGYTGTTPSITIETDYYDDDLDGSPNENLFVPGEVQDEGTFTRRYEDSGVSADEFVDNTNNRIVVNGDSDTGISLSNSNYTAGENGRFVGAPTIYYTTLSANRQNWSNESVWTLIDGTDGADEPGDTGFPGVGDIAVLRNYGNSNDDHWVSINTDLTVAQVIFDNALGGWSPRAIVTDRDANLDLGPVSGVGQFQLFLDASNTPAFVGATDLGEFANETNSQFNFRLDADGVAQMPSNITEYPQVRIEAGNGNNQDNNRILETSIPITVNSWLQLDRSPRFRINHDVTVVGDVRITWQENRTTIELGDDRAVTFDIGEDLLFNNGSGDDAARFFVKNDNQSSFEHRVIVRGNIEVEANLEGSSVFDLYNGAAPNNNAILELAGETDGFFLNNSSGVFTPDLYKVVMNKGTDTTSTFSFQNLITLPEPADINAQPIEVVNGLLIFDDPAINVTLTDATRGDFYLPNTLNSEASSGSGGLEVAAGTVDMVGDDTGIILDGLLRISGGTFDMSDDSGDNGNNFIQYGASDEAVIEVSDGSLLVGSQVRRPLTTTSGLLNYSQTGGIARFGITAAPENIRGVFEVIGAGSEFTHTGGELTIVRENGSSIIGSLIIKPDVGDLNVANSTITIGSADTPANQNDIGIDSDVPLNSILITGNNNPTAKIYNVQLEIDDITIQSGGTFDANGFDFTVNGDFTNDGTYVNGGDDINQQTTIFPTVSTQAISGAGTSNFFNFQKNGSSILTVGKNITVDNDISILDGTVSTGTFALNVEGDMVHDAIHQSDPAGPGIVFSGTDLQNLNTTTSTGEFGVLTLDNSNGLEIPGDGKIFEVNDKVVLSTGVFNIGGNLLIMDESAFFENGLGGQSRTDFNVNSMVSVNASITDNGVRKIYNDAFTGPYLYPLGLNFYTPVEFNVTGITGGNASEVTIKPIEDIAGGIPDDTDETCFGDNSDYVDLDNILQFYWLIRSENVTDFDGSIFLYHVDALEAFDNTQGLDLTNYAPARLLDNSSTWDKGYSEALFDETNNVVMFQTNTTTDFVDFTSADIAGTYTAGITRDDSDNPLCGGAIPDVVPEYVTLSTVASGDVNAIGSYATAPGGTPPSLGESPDLRVAGDFTLNLTNEFWRFRRITIESGATLTISGAGVNLGTVTGDGTLKLINTNALPAGDYATFEANSACTTGGGFELEVTTGNSVDLALPFTRLRRLILSGDGEKIVTNGSSFNICENLEILDGGLLTMGNNTALNIQGDIIKSPSATFDGDFSNALVVMEGGSQQQIDGDFTGIEQITSLEVDNAAGLTVVNTANNNVEVENLIMTSGRITTDADNSLIILSTGDVTGNFSSSTFVDGPLIRRLETTTDRFFFPVGDGSVYLPFEVSNTQGYTGTRDWTVRYYDQDPGTATRVTTVSGATVNATSDFSTWMSETNTGSSVLFRQDLFEVEVASPATADVRPYWDGDTNVGATSDDWENLRVMAWNASTTTWESYGNANPNYSGMSASSGSIVSDTELSFSTNFVTLGANPPEPLPVELTYFNAEVVEDDVLLTWETAIEINNDFFEIQRSKDGVEFEVIGQVIGNGNSNEPIEYSFVDREPYLGLSYYRLRQVDYDGQDELHPIIQVQMVGGGQLSEKIEASIYPNPASPENLNIRILTGDDRHEINVKIVDISGQIYFEERYDGSLYTDQKVEVKRQMIPGLYFMLVEQAGQLDRSKIIIR